MSKWKRPNHGKGRGRLLTALFSRDGTACGICGGQLDRKVADEHAPDYVSIDHVVPLSKGGRDSVENLRLAHQRCNNERDHEAGQRA